MSGIPVALMLVKIVGVLSCTIDPLNLFTYVLKTLE